MNQIQIGRFIAASRKARNLTQRQLADKLGISDKTVSKWERGKGLPEVSLMLPLCASLDITVNDLLSGEQVGDVNYQQIGFRIAEPLPRPVSRQEAQADGQHADPSEIHINNDQNLRRDA